MDNKTTPNTPVETPIDPNNTTTPLPPMPKYDMPFAYAYQQHQQMRKEVKRDLEREEEEKRKRLAQQGPVWLVVLGLVLSCTAFILWWLFSVSLRNVSSDTMFTISHITMFLGIGGIVLGAIKMNRHLGMAIPAVVIGAITTFASFITMMVHI